MWKAVDTSVFTETYELWHHFWIEGVLYLAGLAIVSDMYSSYKMIFVMYMNGGQDRLGMDLSDGWPTRVCQWEVELLDIALQTRVQGATWCRKLQMFSCSTRVHVWLELPNYIKHREDREQRPVLNNNLITSTGIFSVVPISKMTEFLIKICFFSSVVYVSTRTHFFYLKHNLFSFLVYGRKLAWQLARTELGVGEPGPWLPP